MEKEEKIIYLLHTMLDSSEATLEVYSDKLVVRSKKKTLEYNLADIEKVSNSITGDLKITLKNKKVDSYIIGDSKKLRIEVIDYINNQLTNIKVETSNIENNNIKENTLNEEQNNLSDKSLKQTNANIDNNKNSSNIGIKIISTVVLVFIGIFIFNTFFNENDTSDNKAEEQNEKTDNMVGTWYAYDKYGLKEHDNYIVIDGKGNFYNVVGDYSFYKDSGIYTINDDEVIFYTDSSKSSEWRDCTLQTSDKMFCVKGASLTYYQR